MHSLSHWIIYKPRQKLSMHQLSCRYVVCHNGNYHVHIMHSRQVRRFPRQHRMHILSYWQRIQLAWNIDVCLMPCRDIFPFHRRHRLHRLPHKDVIYNRSLLMHVMCGRHILCIDQCYCVHSVRSRQIRCISGLHCMHGVRNEYSFCPGLYGVHRSWTAGQPGRCPPVLARGYLGPAGCAGRPWRSRGCPTRGVAGRAFAGLSESWVRCWRPQAGIGGHGLPSALSGGDP